MRSRLTAVKDWKKLAISAEFRPANVAALCSTSLRHFERFSLETFGKTPKAWLREIQCHLARELIMQGYSNKAVRVELKFASDSHFCHEFKRVFGQSPQTYAPLIA